MRVAIGSRFVVRVTLSSPSQFTERKVPTSPLHSLTWLNKSWLEDLEMNSPFQHVVSFELLTVLNIIKCKMHARFFPEVISLIYLRYLAIQFLGSIEAIPPGIANLWRLGALIVVWERNVRHVGSTLLPVSMWNRKSLRHVDIKRARLNLDEFDLGEPNKLFGGALYLEALGTVFLDVDDSRTTEFLRNFLNLRKLRCELSQGTRQIMKLLLMVGSLLPHLESLRVTSPHDVLPEMKNPNQSPVILSLPRNENLIKLSLSETRIPWSVMSEIGKKVHNLRALKLRRHSCVGKIWDLRDGDFSKLTYLEISSTSNLEEIDVSSCDDQPFPCLEHLVLYDCRKLKEIPSIFGEHCSLERIREFNCSQGVKDSAICILEQQRDFGNGNFQVMVENADEYRES